MLCLKGCLVIGIGLLQLVSVLVIASAPSSQSFGTFGDENYCEAATPTAESYTSPATGAVLQSVLVVHRHGARTPHHVLPHLLPFQQLSEFSCSTHSFVAVNTRTRRHSKATGNDTQGKQYLSSESIPATMLNVSDLQFLPYVSRPAISSAVSPFSSYMFLGDCQAGQLTDLGIQQLHTFGEEFAAIYRDQLGFLSDVPYGVDSDGVARLYSRSTDYFRTRQSIMAFLSAIYPPHLVRDSHHHLKPFDLVVPPNEIDTLNGNSNLCPRLNELQTDTQHGPAWYPLFYSYSDFVAQLHVSLGTHQVPSLDTRRSFTALFDQIFTRYCHSVPLLCLQKPCVNATSLRLLNDLADEENRLRFGVELEIDNRGQLKKQKVNWELLKLYIGPFFSNLIQQFNAFPQKKEKRNNPQWDSSFFPARLQVYSAHDTTVLPILLALNMTQSRMPPYAANIIFELWKQSVEVNNNNAPADNVSEESNYFVRVLYNGKLLSLSFCNSSFECPLRKFNSYLRSTIIPQDILKECHTGLKNSSPLKKDIVRNADRWKRANSTFKYAPPMVEVQLPVDTDATRAKSRQQEL